MLLSKYTEGEDKDGISFIDRDEAMIAALVDIHDVVAVF
jgi:hypothetical protein